MHSLGTDVRYGDVARLLHESFSSRSAETDGTLRVRQVDANVKLWSSQPIVAAMSALRADMCTLKAQLFKAGGPLPDARELAMHYQQKQGAACAGLQASLLQDIGVQLNTVRLNIAGRSQSLVSATPFGVEHLNTQLWQHTALLAYNNS